MTDRLDWNGTLAALVPFVGCSVRASVQVGNVAVGGFRGRLASAIQPPELVKVFAAAGRPDVLTLTIEPDGFLVLSATDFSHAVLDDATTLTIAPDRATPALLVTLWIAHEDDDAAEVEAPVPLATVDA